MDFIEIFEKHPHWQEIVAVMKKLAKSGHQVVLAGGCVRDALLGRTAHDFDIATSATPDEVLKLYPKGLTVGRQFGVIILPYSGFQIEVATFREDGPYVDGRRPESVHYTLSAKADAERRDFTVNALFYDWGTGQLLDYVEGMADLRAGLLRTVGSADRRFAEDKLRLLRVARFAAQLGFDVEAETLAATTKLASTISQVSVERVTDEFKKMSVARDPIRGFVILKSSGLLEAIWPELSIVKNIEKKPEDWGRLLRGLQLIAPVASFELFIATILLCENLGRETSTDTHTPHLTAEDPPFLLSREQKKTIDFLLRGFSTLKSGSDESLLYLNEEHGPLLTELAHVMSMIGRFSNELVEKWIEKFLEVADGQGRLPDPFLNGEDMKRLGVSPSRQMGELLKTAYMAQIRGELRTKAAAEAWVKAQQKKN